MKSLYLLRHAKSDWSQSLPDHQRPLNGRGRRAAPAMADYIAREALDPEVVFCSTATRTRETWEAMEQRLGGDASVIFDDRLYGASPSEIIEVVSMASPDVNRAMVIGHNPGIEELATSLASDGPAHELRRMDGKFPTAALAVLRADINRWSDLSSGQCVLERFIRPKDLPNAVRFDL